MADDFVPARPDTPTPSSSPSFTPPPSPSFTPPPSPWAPPSSSLPGRPMHMPLTEAVLSPQAGHSSRTGWLLGLAVVALLLVGLGTVFALRGNADPVSEGSQIDGAQIDGATDVAGSYSLSAASKQASAATTVRYDMTISAGALGDIQLSAAVDTEQQLVTMTMDVGALLGAGAGAGGTGGGTIDMILDGAEQVIYLDAGGFGVPLPTDATWISFDLATLAAQSGQSVDEFAGNFATNPLDAAVLFDLADPDDIVEVGPEDIDGTPTVHYEVTVDFGEALAANPQLESQLDNGEVGDVPDTLVYDVWVTESNQLRRMSFSIDLAGQSIDMIMNMQQVGGSLDVEIPDANDVFDMAGMLGG